MSVLRPSSFVLRPSSALFAALHTTLAARPDKHAKRTEQQRDYCERAKRQAAAVARRWQRGRYGRSSRGSGGRSSGHRGDHKPDTAYALALGIAGLGIGREVIQRLARV